MERLCIVATERKLWGYVCLPYIVETDRKPSYYLIEPATAKSCERLNMSDDELKVVQNLSELSDQALCRRFSKKKTVKEFIEKTDAKVVSDFIIPFIDRMMNDVLPLIISNKMLMFHKIAGYNNLYETDIVKFNDFKCRPKCFFTLDNENVLRYSLSINYKVGNEYQEKSVLNKKVSEICHNPAALIIDNVLYHFDNIDAKKFTPFYNKRFIAVPSPSVEKYMQSFVRKCIMDYYVDARGFKIKKHEEDCKAVLTVEQTVIGYTIRLNFMYGDERYAYGDNKRSVNLTKEDNSYVFYTCNRHITVEKKYEDVLAELGLTHSSNGIMTIDGEAEFSEIYPILEWINKNKSQLDHESIKVEINSETEYYNGNISLKIDTQNNADWFDINAVIVLDGFEIPFIKLKNHIIHNERKYELPNGQIFILPLEWFASWADVMQFAKESNGNIRIDNIHKALLPKDYIEFDGNNRGELTASDTEFSGTLNAQLRPYQTDGFKWLITLYENKKGGILADDMGLGKTIQTIALLSHIYATAAKRDTSGDTLFGSYNDTVMGASLIVMPVSLVHNWISEINRFAPHLKIYNYAGRNRVKSDEIGRILQHYHIVIVTYGLLRNDASFLSKYQFGYLILDESQFVKNPSSITYKAVTSINAEHHLTISGTPIENNLGDLWAQMNIVNKNLLGSANFFRSYFVNPIEHSQDDSKQEMLKRLIAPYILRRTKETVAKDLPPITEQTVLCEMTPEQSEVYEREKSGCRNELLNLSDSSIQTETFAALKALTRLRLIANHPSLALTDYEGDSGKFEQIIQHISDIVTEGHKILVFSSFVRDLELIRSELNRLNIGNCTLTGHTHDRQSVINTFQNDSSISVFLISLKAGGVGLNLTTADYVLMLNPWWNPQAEKQAIDRAHRIGQTKHVFVYRYITRNTIEEKIAKLQEKKRQLADTFINSETSYNLSTEEIRQLLTE
ncbi:MAG: DEAD/DEAH box helicase [Bacteroidales bacterium]|nr:DEAD/DEAH box helicase [Bacteroidales bacterium]